MAKSLQDLASELRNAPPFDVEVKRELTKFGLKAELLAKKNISGSPLKTRTGRLRQSIKHIVRMQKGAYEAGIQAGSNEVKYAAIHEYGGVVTPKKGKYLSIPMEKAKTGAGVSRYASPRDAGKLFFFKSKSGKHFLARKVGGKKSKRIELMYFLTDRVEIPKTKYLSSALEDAYKDVRGDIREMMRKVVNGE